MIIKLNKEIRRRNKTWFEFVGIRNNDWIVKCDRLANGRYRIESLDGDMYDTLSQGLLFD